MVKGNSHTRLYEAHIPSPLPTFESLKIPFSEPQIFILQTLVSTRSLAQEKFQSIPLLKSFISSISLSGIRILNRGYGSENGEGRD